MKRRNCLNLRSCLFAVFIIFLHQNLWGQQQNNPQEIQYAQLPVFALDANEGFPVLIEQMKDRKAILLGDGSHGTDEFYSFRKKITRTLIRDHGVRVWVLEAEWDSAQIVDLYIRGMLPPEFGTRQVLQEAFERWPEWVWANESLVEFVRWLKEFNKGRESSDMVRCFGMDMQMAVNESLQLLEQKISPFPQLHQRYQYLTYWWEPYLENPMLLNQAYVDEVETGCLLATEILGKIDNPDFETRRVLKMLIAIEEYYRTMSYDRYEAWNIRSRHFSSYVQDLFKFEEAANGIVAWAHNSHIGDMRGTETGDIEMLSFGMLMRQALGNENVFLLGSTGYSGTVVASSNWGAEPQIVEVPPPHKSSVEAFINSGGWSNPMILFENEQQRRLWSFNIPHRGIGVVYSPEAEFPDNYLTSRIGQRYDGLVFWKKTQALQQILEW